MDFNSILIGSENPERLVEYYTKVLGEPALSDGGYNGKNPQPGRIIWNIQSNDVQGDFDRMKAAGATVVTEPYSFEGQEGSAIATFSDPDDNYFQLMSPMEM